MGPIWLLTKSWRLTTLSSLPFKALKLPHNLASKLSTAEGGRIGMRHDIGVCLA